MTTDDAHSLGECLKYWRLRKGLPLELIALKTRIPLNYLRALEDNDFSTLPPIQAPHPTLGDSLRACRQQRGLSLETIAQQTRIPLAYLQALEENDSFNLPAALVIARSYVVAYLACLDLQNEQEQNVMIQFARLVESVYLRPSQEPAESPVRHTRFGSRWGLHPIRTMRAVESMLVARVSTLRAGWYERSLGLYFRLIDWRITFCRRTTSAGTTAVCCIRQGIGQFSDGSATTGRTVVDTLSTLVECFRGKSSIAKERPAVWSHALTAGGWQLRHSFVLMHRDTGPHSNEPAAFDQPADSAGPTPTQTGSSGNQSTRNMGAKMWVWLVQYGITVLLLLLLGSMAANITLFKETVIPDTKLDASHLIEFLGYSGALVMVWLMGRKTAGQLDRDRTAFFFLRPLVTPLTALLVVSAGYKVLLVLLNPVFDKTDRLTYNWIFVAMIVASTLWLILAWFLKSAPMLESLEAAGRTKHHPDGTNSRACPQCNSSIPASMKFCGHCGVALASSHE